MKYVVTDPAYIAHDDEWCEWVDSHFIHRKIESKLYALSNHKAWCCDTGYGDWTNYLQGENVKRTQFCADTGLVCVCALTDEIEHRIQRVPDYCVAIFEAPDDIHVEMSRKDPRWTMVRVFHGDKEIVTSTNSEKESDEYFVRHSHNVFFIDPYYVESFIDDYETLPILCLNKTQIENIRANGMKLVNFAHNYDIEKHEKEKEEYQKNLEILKVDIDKED